ncbi:unnamed protein product [Brassica oleracea]|uniref:Uncharacterized protein n=1 Tax=Brassica cretica TaxID=69181 RepID=A0ABQ7CQN7_BRACR|nr:hypothetical protein DY000_02013883 [Brassica cretica]
MEGDGASGGVSDGEKRSNRQRETKKAAENDGKAEASLWKDTAFIVSEHVVFSDRTVSVKRITRSVLMSWTDGYTSSRRQDIKELKTALEEAKNRLHVTG